METNRSEITKLIGFIGGAMLVAGYFRSVIQEVWGKFNLGLVIGGAVLLAVSIAMNFGAIVHIFRGRQGRLGANTAVLSIAVLALLGIANFLGYRHHKRFDLTAEGIHTLAEQTRKIVGNLQKDVKVIRFERLPDGESQRLETLMGGFRYLSKRVTYERVDPQQKPEVARQYAVSRIPDTVVVSGERTERPQTMDEQAMVNAVMKVTRDKLKRICFVEGHGEKSLSATEGDGISIVDRVLKNENYETKSVNLTASAQVPAECDVLASVGPKKPFLPQETAMIGKYLDEGGKTMFLVDPSDKPEDDPQLGDLLKPWNIVMGADTVLDNSGARMAGSGLGVPVVQNYPEHPITKDLKGVFTIFPLPRSVKTGDGGKGEASYTELLKTSDNSWAETSFAPGAPPQFDAGKDTKGPISIGVGASKKVGEKEARLVVIGDADFASNAYIRTAGNGDLVFNTLNWLAQDEDLISIRPKAPSSRSITMNESQQNLFFWVVVLLLPLAVAGTGGYIWWKRR
jgi:ABC-type uncharacterized transport system involved in gliding motility auxiliary subunit